ncbi:MAG: Do family serine endopeptidase [Phycisphaerae bacterium]
MKHHTRIWIPLILALAVLGYLILDGPALLNRLFYAAESGRARAVREHLVQLSEYDRNSVLFQEVARAVKPAVVEVRVVKEIAREARDERLDSFSGNGRMYYSRGLGSGVIVDAGNGYVLTNHHVIGDATEVEVILHDRRSFFAQWVRSDPATDLAVLKIPSERLVQAPVGDSDEINVGDQVLAIGSPEGLPQTVTMGIISATGRTSGRPGRYQEFLQTDAAINHGNSGGPLVNMRGEVIGINTAIVSRSGVNEGLGLAIPSNMASHIMEQLIARGEVTRGYLGVKISDLDHPLARKMGLPDPNGVLISGVAPEGPAAEAGLEPGDVILSVNDDRILSVNDLRNRVAELRSGETYPFTVWRHRRKQRVDVTIADQPQNMNRAFQSFGSSGMSGPGRELGMEIAPLTRRLRQTLGYSSEVRGMVVMRIAPNSPAVDKGVRPGTVITQLNGRSVQTLEELSRLLARSGEQVSITVARRDGSTKTYRVKKMTTR